jgi:hypothetical protein
MAQHPASNLRPSTAARASSRASAEGLPPGVTDLGEGASVAYYPAWLPADAAADACSRVDGEVAWASGEIFIFGRHVLQPRQFAYQADRPPDNPDMYAYTYSRTRQVSGGMPGGVPGGRQRRCACPRVRAHLAPWGLGRGSARARARAAAQIPRSWTPEVLAIKAQVEALAGCTFNR